ncbi:MAG: hypothetical protein GF320_14170, partial [Armatimonadia bacterium]|nr:hypothetical protein [Armatimonadia bacterium]
MQHQRMTRAYTEEDKVAEALASIIGTKAAPCVLHARLCTVDAELYECGTEDDPEQDVSYDIDGAAIEDRYFRLYHPDDLLELLDYVREYPEPSAGTMGRGCWLTDRPETFSDTWEERSFHFEDLRP